VPTLSIVGNDDGIDGVILRGTELPLLGTQQDRLSEGALGFALVLGAMYAVTR